MIAYLYFPLALQLVGIASITAILYFLAGGVLSATSFFIVKYLPRFTSKSKAIHVNSIFDENDQLHVLLNNLPDSVYIKDSSSKYILCNQQFARVLKEDNPEKIYGKTDLEIYPNNTGKKYIEEDQEILSGKKEIIQRIKESEKDGVPTYSRTTKVPIKTKKGEIIGLMGTHSDISEQVIASNLLEEKNAALEKERILFRALMDNMPDTIYIKDSEGRFLDGNPTIIDITKAGSQKNLIGKTDFDFFPKHIAEVYEKDDKKCLQTGKPVFNEEQVSFDADGNILVKSTIKVPFKDSNGKTIGLVGIGRDITKLKEVEEKLKEQAQHLQETNVLLEERQEEINQQSDELSAQNKILEEEKTLLRTLIDSIPAIIYLKDINSRFITVNKRLMQIFKIENLDDVIGKEDRDFYPADYIQDMLKDDKKVLSSGEAIFDKEEPGIDEKGNFIHLLTTKVPLRNPEGNVVGVIGICRDITSIKEAEIALKEQSEGIKEVNVLLEERQEEIQQQSNELKGQNTILENERNQLRVLIDTLPDFIYIKDKESRFIVANKKLVETFKVPSHEYLEGKIDFDFYPKEIAQMYYDDEQRIIKSQEPLISKEEIGLDSEGNELIVATTKVPFYNSEGQVAGIVGIGRDITKMRQYSKKLELQADNLKNNNSLLEEKQEEIQKQSEYVAEQNRIIEIERHLLRTLIDNIPDFIYVKDKESRFQILNKRLLKIIGRESVEEVIGKTDFDLPPIDEYAQIYYDDEQRIIATGKPMVNKEEAGYDEHKRDRVISTTKVPYYDVDKKIAGIVGIGRDITKQKNAEKQLREQAKNMQEVNMILEERQEKIQQQSEEIGKQSQILKKANTQLEQLNATKNKFFSIIAHDLKNPFQAIFGFSELLQRNFEDFEDPQKMELLGMIKTSSESAYDLLENLLQWARTQTDRIKYNPTNIDLAELIQQSIEVSQGSAESKHISLISEINCDLPAYADMNMINFVVRNLISNAIKFTENNGVITIECSESSETKQKNMIAMSISDTGIGISEENISKLFRIDEYFSTSGTAGEGGTGLGLIICKEFVEMNNGTIKIESELGVGTTFTFTLPKGE